MSTPNQSSLQQPPSPSPSSVSSDISFDHSAQFSPTPPPSLRLSNSPDFYSQRHPHLVKDEQLEIPLFHETTGLPVTVPIRALSPSPHLVEDEQLEVPLFHEQTLLPITIPIHALTPSPHPFPTNQLDSQPHPHLIPTAQSPNTEHSLPSSTSPVLRHAPLPELPLHLLPQAEDEFDDERVQQVLERLQNANNRRSSEAPQHEENGTATAVGTEGDGASAPARNPVMAGVSSPQYQGGAGPSGLMSKNLVKRVQNHEDGTNRGVDANRSMEEAITQGCNGDTVGSQSPTNGKRPFRETVKEEPVLEQTEGVQGQERSGLIEQPEGIDAHEEITARPSGVLDDGRSSDDPSPAQVQPDGSPATSDRGQPRRTGRKRRRGEVDTGYWLRSRKPPSSSKRSRRTNYWLRP